MTPRPDHLAGVGNDHPAAYLPIRTHDLTQENNDAIESCEPSCSRRRCRGDFFETYFGLSCFVVKGEKLIGMRDDTGMSIVFSNFDGGKKIDYPEWFHVGFRQSSDEKVDDIHERLKSNGIEVGEREDIHGAWAFYFKAPGGFTVEVSHQRDAS